MTDAGAARTAGDGAVGTTDVGAVGTTAVRAVGTTAVGAAHRGRAGGRWRAWRRSRPFWGGLLVALGGAEMLVTLRAPLPVILHVGPQGLAGYLVPLILLLCGVLLVAHPPQRVFYALISMVLALVSWLSSNLGGFFIGMLLALIGGCLAFAWTPVKSPRAARPAAPGPTPAETGDDDPAPEEEPATVGGPTPAPQADWVASSPSPYAGAEPDDADDRRHRRVIDQA